MTENRAYYAVIPADVRYDSSVSSSAKLLYGEISALCNQKGFCWANNAYFQELYSVGKNSILRWIKELEEGGYIKKSIQYDGKGVIGRCLSIALNDTTQYQKWDEGGIKNVTGPSPKNVTHNNTSINNTINKEKIYKKEKFTPPTLSEIEAYCKERNSSVSAKVFYEYFAEGKWHDSEGKPVKNWKQKIITWERSGRTDTQPKKRFAGERSAEELDFKASSFDEVLKRGL